MHPHTHSHPSEPRPGSIQWVNINQIKSTSDILWGRETRVDAALEKRDMLVCLEPRSSASSPGYYQQ